MHVTLNFCDRAFELLLQLGQRAFVVLFQCLAHFFITEPVDFFVHLLNFFQAIRLRLGAIGCGGVEVIEPTVLLQQSIHLRGGDRAMGFQILLKFR